MELEAFDLPSAICSEYWYWVCSIVNFSVGPRKRDVQTSLLEVRRLTGAWKETVDMCDQVQVIIIGAQVSPVHFITSKFINFVSSFRPMGRLSHKFHELSIMKPNQILKIDWPLF